jgi:TolB-like protein
MQKKCLLVILLYISAIFAQSADQALNNLADKLVTSIDFTNKPTLAVVPFENKITSDSKLGYGIAEYLVAVFQNNPSITLVDRLSFHKTMEELALSQTGVIDETKTVEIGKTAAAQYLCTGTISLALGKAMINARIIETETGTIVSSANTSVDTKALSAFTNEILGEKGNVGPTVFRSMVVPGWGQLFVDKPARGILSLICFLGTAGCTIGSGIATGAKSQEYDDFYTYAFTTNGQAELKADFDASGNVPTDPTEYQNTLNTFISSQIDDHFDRYENQKKMTIIFGCATGAVWSLNLIDAAIAGVQSKKKLKLYFSANPITISVDGKIVMQF